MNSNEKKNIVLSFFEPEEILSIFRKTPLISSLFVPTDLSQGLKFTYFELIFPMEISGNARIRYNYGSRIIDWEGKEWVAYEKDGVRWFRDDLTEKDFQTLFYLLTYQIGIWYEFQQISTQVSPENISNERI